jgi:hypothetical protein
LIALSNIFRKDTESVSKGSERIVFSKAIRYSFIVLCFSFLPFFLPPSPLFPYLSFILPLSMTLVEKRKSLYSLLPPLISHKSPLLCCKKICSIYVLTLYLFLFYILFILLLLLFIFLLLFLLLLCLLFFLLFLLLFLILLIISSSLELTKIPF